MRTASRLLRLFHTVRYLRPVQVTYRIRRTLHRPRLSPQPPPPRRLPSGDWERPALRPAVLLGPSRFRIFQQEIEVDQAAAWQDPQWSHLVQYNLHYFDDLRASGASQRAAWQRGLINRWIDENPPGKGPGWEPYPLSLRIVNWIEWALAGNELSAPQLSSLATQVRCLARAVGVPPAGESSAGQPEGPGVCRCVLPGPGSAALAGARGTTAAARDR